ncbi:MAG TPA: M10 family metallopeptidase C-terminal domain-containing protein [Allosphingosinicella sp.]|nr:M10 family metallopeptidase C-terminal domain-containing protein [Allosphingosinicella sp.]
MRKALREDGKNAAPGLRDHDGDVVRQAVLAPNGKEIFTLPQVIAQLTAAGTAWNGAPGNPTPRAGVGTITFAFFNNANEVYSEERSEFVPLSEAQRVAVRSAFAIWGDVVGVSFVEGNVSTADINIGNIDTAEDHFSAYASYPGFGLRAGDIWISLLADTNQEIGLGEPGFRTLMHEIGHALGLSHPGDYNAAPDVEITYAEHAEYYQDSYEYTIMSYFGSSNTGAIRNGFAATPLAHDIAALQSLYGVNPNTRTGDTVYGFNSTADRAAFDFALNANPVVAIWDSGGMDMLDFSGWSAPSRIDLRDGAMNDGGGQTSNVQIAFGTLIENAVTGAGNDSLTGNAAANRLSAGEGEDSLRGGLGGDRLQGGGGADVFVFGAAGDSRDVAPRSDGKKGAPDRLGDFVSGVDKIDLGAIDADQGIAGDQAFSFIGANAFSGVAGQLRAQAFGSELHIYGDTDGDLRADFHIVASGTQILASDFIL